jgi:hypothetical protein
MQISLLDLAESNILLGSSLGKRVFDKLIDIVQHHPQKTHFSLSVKGAQWTDVTFARESVLKIARAYRGVKSFCLVDLKDADHIDNWGYAADSKGQPLMGWADKESHILGCQLTPSSKKMVEHVIKCGTVTTGQISDAFDITIHNASTTLKRLFMQGYLMRTDCASATGGREFLYHGISPILNTPAR